MAAGDGKTTVDPKTAVIAPSTPTKSTARTNTTPPTIAKTTTEPKPADKPATVTTPPAGKRLTDRNVELNVGFVRDAFTQGYASSSVQEIQLALVEAGLNVGDDVYGRAGRLTQAALADFQRSHGIDATDAPDARTLQLLGFTIVG